MLHLIQSPLVIERLPEKADKDHELLKEHLGEIGRNMDDKLRDDLIASQLLPVRDLHDAYRVNPLKIARF